MFDLVKVKVDREGEREGGQFNTGVDGSREKEGELPYSSQY